MIGFHSIPETLGVAHCLAESWGRGDLKNEFKTAREAALSLIAERDALKAQNARLWAVVHTFKRAGFGNSTDFRIQGSAFRLLGELAATKEAQS